MEYRNLKYMALISSFATIFLFTNCATEEEPVPIDCNVSTLEVNFSASNPTSCGVNDGIINATATGGNGPYLFNIDGEAFTTANKFESLGAGTYRINIKDKNNCVRSASVILAPTGSTLAASLQTTESGCNLDNGVIFINATGGTGPYSYTLNNGEAIASNAFVSLTAGSYSVKVTDQIGCSITETVRIESGVKYSTKIKAIIETSCAITNCHVEGSNLNLKLIGNIQSRTSDLIVRIQTGNMPKNLPKLQQADIDAIVCWANDGALDN